MNILKRELRANLKAFLFWTLGLFALAFAGMTKFTGIEGGGVDINTIIGQFPKVVQSLMGIVGADPNTLGGYFAIITYYVIICASIYAISLGFHAVSREAVDKTYEFLFTKPRTRSYILYRKLEASLIYLTLFSILNYLFSIAAISTLKVKDDLSMQIFLFCAEVYIVSLVFFSLSVLISALVKETEKGSRYSNLVFLFTFLAGIACDMMDNPGLLRVLAPMKYFIPDALLANSLSAPYAALCAIIIAGSFFGAFKIFKKKDLSAV